MDYGQYTDNIASLLYVHISQDLSMLFDGCAGKEIPMCGYVVLRETAQWILFVFRWNACLSVDCLIMSSDFCVVPEVWTQLK